MAVEMILNHPNLFTLLQVVSIADSFLNVHLDSKPS